MAIVQSVYGQGTGTVVAATYPSIPTLGNLLVAIVYSGTAVATPDTVGGWTKAVDMYNGGSTPSSSIFYKIAGVAEPPIVTWTFAASAVNNAIFLMEYPPTYTVLDRVVANGGGTTSGTTGSTGTTLSTTDANELLIAAITPVTSSVGQNTWTNGFTQVASNNRIQVADQYVSSPGAYETTNTWTTSRRWAAGMVTFKAPGGTTFKPQISMFM